MWEKLCSSVYEALCKSMMNSFVRLIYESVIYELHIVCRAVEPVDAILAFLEEFHKRDGHTYCRTYISRYLTVNVNKFNHLLVAGSYIH